jgi:Predicted nucleotide-binding protein containing TIR-like domain
MAMQLSEVTEGSLNGKKRSRKLRPFPTFGLEASLVLARSIAENNGCKPYSRLSLAASLDRSSESSAFRGLIISSTAYGLTEGSYQAPQLKLTELGLSIVAPKSEEEKRKALVHAALNIALFKKLYEHFDQHKIPSHENFKNTLMRDYSLDPDLVNDCINQFKADGKFVGLIRNVAGADRVSVDDAGECSEITESEPGNEKSSEDEPAISGPSSEPRTYNPLVTQSNARVFITHGKKHEIVEQLKELLTFGRLIPVVAQEHETLSKPVPEKVLEDMRSCFAGIIHVSSEEELLDRSGNIYHKINENVLIEIGAAMALYKGHFILLVQKGIHLPSNLQGLYRCEYEGGRLDYEATMKLLKAFNEFK